MPQLLLQIALGAVLAASAGLKLAKPRESVASLAVFGFSGGVAGWVAWGSLVAVEAALAVGVVVGSDFAAYTAAALMVALALVIVGAIFRGRAGAPCACFGPQGRIGWSGVGRNVLLAGAYAALPAVPGDGMSTDAWLATGLVVALAGCGALALAVISLAREVGMLRLRLGPESALEIPDEGPAISSRAAVASEFEVGARTELLAAVFLSDGCHICKTIRPQIDNLAREPFLSLHVFDEVADTEAWQQMGVPGSPYAVALDLDGTVLAKGSFNTLGQLESVLATAERRRGAPTTLAESIGV